MNGLEALDKKLFVFLNSDLSNRVLDVLMPFITKNPALFLLPVFAFLLYRVKSERFKVFILPVVGLLLNDGVTHLLKELIKRSRPFVENSDVILLVGKGGSFSMPSAHASNVAAVSAVLGYLIWKHFKGRIRIVGMTYLSMIVVLIGLSRVYVGVHYPSDVLVGTLLGLIIGLTVIYANVLFTKGLTSSPVKTLLVFSLVGISLFRLYYIFFGPLDLSPDEAQYWDWSRHLDLSYYSKGPGIAYIIYLSRSIFGDTPFGVRLPAVMFSLGSSLLIYYFTRDRAVIKGVDQVRSERAGLAAALTLQVIPLFSAYGVINTIDAPLIFFWSLALYLFGRIDKTERELRMAKAVDWITLGIVIGLGFLVKYTMVFFVASGFLYYLVEKKRRRYLKRVGPWMAFVSFLVVSSPVFLWNADHGWVTFLHTAGQAHIADGFRITPERLIEFIGSQIGVITPVLFFALFISVFSMKKRYGEIGMSGWFMLPTFLFFLLKSLQGKVQANWALPAYLSSLAALGVELATSWRQYSRGRRSVVVAGYLLAVFITVIAHYPSLVSLPVKYDPSARLRGWSELGDEVTRVAQGMKRPFFIASDRYQITSELAFYVKGNPTTYCLNRGRRMNQYDLWQGYEGLKGYDAIMVFFGDSPVPKDLVPYFDNISKRVYTVKEGKDTLREYTILIGRNFKGMERRGFESF